VVVVSYPELASTVMILVVKPVEVGKVVVLVQLAK